MSGERYTMRYLAGPGEMFTPDAFDAAIGNAIVINREGRPPVPGRVVAVDVSEDGSEATLTWEA